MARSRRCGFPETGAGPADAISLPLEDSGTRIAFRAAAQGYVQSGDASGTWPYPIHLARPARGRTLSVGWIHTIEGAHDMNEASFPQDRPSPAAATLERSSELTRITPMRLV